MNGQEKDTLILIVILLLGIIAGQRFVIMKSRKKRHQMGHDELTGLCNWEHLVQKSKSLYKNDRPGYVIYSNIVEFKLINELFGREKGNEILKKQAEQVRKYAVEGCLYGRAGADHFIEPLESMCDKAILAIDSIRGNAQEIVAYYDESMLENALKWKKAVDEFGDAIKNNEFHMYLQPQICAETGKLYGAEALVRRISADGKMIPPNEFVPIYEKSGLICQMDRFIWEQAAKKLGEWTAKGKEMKISVNISPKDFYYIDICDTFKNLVEKYQISPGNLNIEITETMIMSEIPNLKQELKKLRKSGFIVEIDDFGSGYSSLNALKDIDVDVLKIDMGFLRKTENIEKSKIILSSVIRMAKEMSMPVITEGVESAEQIEMLTHMGCDIFQGYYFSKPVCVKEFEEKYFTGKNDDSAQMYI